MAMSIFTFISQDELDDLSDDPRQAFGELAQIGQRRLGELISKLDPETQTDWNRIEELNHSFMNMIIASSKRLEIEPFASMEVPKQNDYKNYQFVQFRSDVDHYLTQLALDNSFRNRKNSVSIPDKSKDNIRSYLNALKDCIDKAQISDAKRKALLEHLVRFEQELEKRRLSLLEVTKLTLAVMALPGGAWASVEITMKLVNNILLLTAEAKENEDSQPSLSGRHDSAQKALSPPRKIEKAAKPPFDDDLDDDVPF